MAPNSLHREFAVDVVRKLREAGHTALFAGGCVRDLLLGRPAKDFDVATTARPDQVRQLFGFKRTLAIGASFGVIVVLGPRGLDPVEVATFRTEGPYEDGRRPTRVAFCTPEEDARRRDFTINGMFYDPLDAVVMDYVGGEADLAARIVRAIGDPHERMTEDKLRMLRAIRFAATLDFALESQTAQAIRAMAAELSVVSAERIAQELRKMLVHEHRRRAVELCEDVHLLGHVLQELAWSPGERERTLRMLDLLQQPSFELALASVLHTQDGRTVEQCCRRLKLSNDETHLTRWLVDHQHDLESAHELALAPLKRQLAHPHRDELLSLLRAKLLATDADLHPVLFCAEYLERTPQAELNPVPLITGDDLKTLGQAPGPRFREILEQIRDAQLDNSIATRDEALGLARQMFGL